MKNLILLKMKKFILLMTVLMASMVASAQDTINFHNGRVEAAKVMEVGMGKIKYKKIANLDGPLYLLDESEVASIKYQNGDVETFAQPVQVAPVESYSPVRQRRVVLQAGPVFVDRTYNLSPASYPLTYCKESPSGIAFDGDYISEQDASNMLGYNYNTFLQNERRYRSGRVMWIAGAALIFVSGPIAIDAAIEDSYIAREVSLTALTAGFVLVPVGVVRFASGKVRMKRVLKDYNLDYNLRKNGSAELKFGLTGNGVGMNLTF